MERYGSPTPPRTNQYWPEAFGFGIGGNAPVIITYISENSLAQKSGLRPGDQLLEVDDVNVQNFTKDEIISLARKSKRVPPGLCVISRIRNFVLRRRGGTFGFTVRGDGPVFVSQLEGDPAREAGIRIGDMLVEVNNTSVREMTCAEVEQLVNTSGSLLHLVLIAGVKSIEEIEKKNTASRFRRAREFFQQMNYYLGEEKKKKSQLVKLLSKFAKDKSVETLAKGIIKILETPLQKRLIPAIIQLIPRDKRKLFTDILQEGQFSDNTAKGLVRSTSLEEQLNHCVQPSFVQRTASKYRTWSRGSSPSGNKTPVHLSPTSPSAGAGRSVSLSSPIIPDDFEPSTLQRSYSSSSSFPSRKSPEAIAEDFRTVQNLTETLRYQMNQFLTRGEQLVLKQRLKEYHIHRSAEMLVASLHPILDDPVKVKLVPYLSQLLPTNEQNAFDKEAQKLISKFFQDRGVEGPDVIDVAYRVQGLRLVESPQPKNVIGGMPADDLDVIPVKETANNARSNESSTVAALLTAAENTNFKGKPGNTIIVEAQVHSEKRPNTVQLNSPKTIPTVSSLTAVENKFHVDSKVSSTPTIPPALSQKDDEANGKGQSKSPTTHKDLSSAVENQRKLLDQKAATENKDVPSSPSGGFVPTPPAPGKAVA